MIDKEFFGNLNNAQLEVVKHIDGPSLVIAGAGSGKTMVLTYKIAYLLKIGFPPSSILALTFTNKAAKEMKERIAKLVNTNDCYYLWMGTFHSIFSRILHIEIDHLKMGYNSNFTIYQPSDCKSLLKTIIKELGLDDKTYKPGFVLNRISQAKNSLVTSNEYLNDSTLLRRDSNSNTPKISSIYKIYTERCRQSNAMDFDDLLLNTYLLFQNNQNIANKYAEKFQYILVDEYQDTNFAQHKILQLLTTTKNNICAVGDDAQSIYSFRGANIDNILNFTQQYAGCKLYKLEQNYRSTQTIVGAANSLIAKNEKQIPKTIYSQNPVGEKIVLRKAISDIEEGEIVTRQILTITKKYNIPFSNIAILYRTNAQSRIFEETNTKYGIPYRIYGGHSFYDQKIIKDILAYFRLIINKNDEEAFKRIINYPTRGIGTTTVGKILNTASEYNISIWEVITDPCKYNLKLQAKASNGIQKFHDIIQELSESNANAYEIAIQVLKQAEIIADVQKEESTERKDKLENIDELLNAINTFISKQTEEGNGDLISLRDYLNEISLISESEQFTDKEENNEVISLMTIHAAKGLEFDAVFIVGLEEELFPNTMALNSPKEIEEERRLFYVALTRARKMCFLSYSSTRFRFGQTDSFMPSRFISEISPEFLIKSNSSNNYSHNNTSKYRSSFNFSNITTSPNNSYKPQTFKNSFSTSVHRITKPSKSIKQETIESIHIDGKLCKIGSTVEHQRFGIGQVLEITGESDNYTLVINFRNVGEKHLLLKYAKLQVI